MTVALKVLRTKNAKPVLGEFSKGVPGSVSCNFGLSAGKYCDTSCAYHPENEKSKQAGRCYAIRIEQRHDRQYLRQKLERHEDRDPGDICEQALEEMKKLYANGQTVPWFRFSTGGSVPKPSQVTKKFLVTFIELLDWLDARNIPIHLPVESDKKFRFYRKLVGTRCVIRRSAHDKRAFVSATYPVSFVVGTLDMTRKERVAAAKVVAAEHADKTGRKSIVCPAVAASYLHWTSKSRETNQKAKCGSCTCCSQAGIDVVFPLH